MMPTPTDTSASFYDLESSVGDNCHNGLHLHSKTSNEALSYLPLSIFHINMVSASKRMVVGLHAVDFCQNASV